MAEREGRRMLAQLRQSGQLKYRLDIGRWHDFSSWFVCTNAWDTFVCYCACAHTDAWVMFVYCCVCVCTQMPGACLCVAVSVCAHGCLGHVWESENDLWESVPHSDQSSWTSAESLTGLAFSIVLFLPGLTWFLLIFNFIFTQASSFWAHLKLCFPHDLWELHSLPIVLFLLGHLFLVILKIHTRVFALKGRYQWCFSVSKRGSWVCQYTPSIPPLVRQMCRLMWPPSQPGLHSEFQSSDSYIVKPCLTNLRAEDMTW